MWVLMKVNIVDDSEVDDIKFIEKFETEESARLYLKEKLIEQSVRYKEKFNQLKNVPGKHFYFNDKDTYWDSVFVVEIPGVTSCG